MDCEKLDALAIDLVYEDESEPRARAPELIEAEAHLQGCPRCTALVERLRQGRRAGSELPIEDPSSLLEARILSMASAHQPVVPITRRVLRALSTAGSYAMRPQVAMAAVLVLMVGSSVLLMRSGRVGERRTRVTDEGTPVATVERDQTALQEGAGAPGVLPRRAEGDPAANAPAVPGDGKPTDVPAEAKGKLAASGEDLEQKNKEAADKDLSKAEEAPKSPAPGQAGDDDGLFDTKEASKKGTAGTVGKEGEKAKDKGGVLGGVAPPAAAAPTTTPTVATATGAAGGTSTVTATPATFDDSMTAYKEARYAAAAKGFEAAAAAGTKPSTSTLWAARSFRASGSCGQALPRFQKVLSTWPSSAEVPNAAFEGGECARQLGDNATARTLFEKAKTYSVTKARAEKALAELDAPPPSAPAKAKAASKADAVDSNK